MNRSHLLKTLHLLSKKYEYNDQEEALFAIEELLLKYLTLNPDDINAELRLAIAYYMGPWADGEKAQELILRTVKKKPEYIISWILLAYIEHFYFKEVTENTYQTLSQFSIRNSALKSLVFYVQSWFFKDRQEKNNYEKMLLKSIQLSSMFVWNYLHLGLHYKENSNPVLARNFFINGLLNVKTINCIAGLYTDWTSINLLFNINIKGIYISQTNFSHYLKLLNEISA